MGKEQELLQAVKSGDLLSTQKLLSKVKTNRNSEFTCPSLPLSAISHSNHEPCHELDCSRGIWPHVGHLYFTLDGLSLSSDV